MEKLYISRLQNGQRLPGNVNIGLVSENEIVKLVVYSDAFYLSEQKQLKVSLTRENEVAPFEEFVLDIDSDKEQMMATFELGVRNDLKYLVTLTLPTENEDVLFLNELDEEVNELKQNVPVIEMTSKINRPMAFLAKASTEEKVHLVDIFAQKGMRLLVGEEEKADEQSKGHRHEDVEKKEVSGTLFQKVKISDTLSESHIFYEVGEEGLVVSCYRRMYFIGSLIAREQEQDVELHGGIINGKLMYDVTPLLESFDFDLADGMPEQANMKIGAGLTDQTFAQPEILKELVLEAKPYDELNSSGYMGYEKPAESYALMNGAFQDAGQAAMVSLIKGDYARSVLIKTPKKGVAAGPKVKTFYRGDDLHVIVYGEGKSALVWIGATKEVFKGKAVTGEQTHFVFKDSKAFVGKMLNAVIVAEDSSNEAVKMIVDIEELYPITPVITEVLTAKTVASFSFNYPSDGRYAHARLYQQGILVRDKIKGAKVIIQALEPSKTYSFELAFVDIEEYESARVPVTLTTLDSGVISYNNRLELKVDDIEVTFKI